MELKIIEYNNLYIDSMKNKEFEEALNINRILYPLIFDIYGEVESKEEAKKKLADKLNRLAEEAIFLKGINLDYEGMN